MNSILIIAHAPLASALRSAALHALPDAASRVDAIDVLATESPTTTLDAAREKIQARQRFGILGTLVLSDVLGATPCNVAQQLTRPTEKIQIKCIAGVSLPMLLRAITYSDEPLSVMAEKALAGASLGAVELT